MDDFFDSVGELWDTTTELAGEVGDTLGSAWDSFSIFRDPPNEQYNAAQKAFKTPGELGYQQFNIPKLKYSFIVEFELTPFAKQFIRQFLPDSHAAFNDKNVSCFVKDAQLPGVSYELEVLNQYNKTRISPGKNVYKPVQMTFFDTVDSSALLMFDAYNKFYYGDSFDKNKNSYRNDTLSSPQAFEAISEHWGRTIINNGDYDSQYFFKQINIYEIDNDTYTCHNMINAYIQEYTPDIKSHDSSGEVSSISLTLQYEALNNLGPLGTPAVAAPSIELAQLILSTSMYGKAGFFKMFGAMDDKLAGLASVNNILRGAGAVYDITTSIGDIISGDISPDTIRNLGNAISVGSEAIGFGDETSSANNSFGLGNILGDF